MESVYYDYEYFRKFLLQKKNFEYEKYKYYDVRDFMIECLNDETIYDYYSLDGNMFYYYFFYPNRSEPWDDEICPGKPFDDFSNLFISPEVRLKVMLFIQQNAEEIWPHTNYLLVQEECSRIIHKTLKRLEESNFTYNMPRPNYRELLYSPHFLTEKTPSRRWSEEHNLDKSAIPAIKSHDQDDVEDVHSSSDKLEKVASTLTPIEGAIKTNEPSNNIIFNIQQSTWATEPNRVSSLKNNNNMTEQEKIALLERLTASGAQIGQLNLGDGHQYFGCSITQTSSAPSSTSKVVQVVDVLASSCDTQESSANPYPFVKNPNKAEEIIGLLKQYMRGIDLSKPKDLMMPVRAAIVAGVIRKPSYTEFKDALPDFTPKHSSSLDHYLRYEILPNGKENDQYNPYKTIPAYKKMVEAFEAFKV